MSIKIEIVGVDKLAKTLSQMEAIKEPVAEAMELYLEKVVTDAKSIVPVRTGTLQRSIMFTGGEGEYTVGSRVHYASFVEYGTSRMRPKPFLTPALLWNISVLKEALLNIVSDCLRRRGE
jgi:HK97 gp10 family phage protein